MLKNILSLALVLIIAACGTPETSPPTGLTPLPETLDPKDSVLFDAVKTYVAKSNAPPNSVYDHVRVDLNGDGLRDGIVLFKLPHSYWCGWDGCGMVIFRADKTGFVPVSAISGVRGPIYISKGGINGWRDIIIRLSGTNLRDKNVVLQFEGGTYPSSPMLAPDLPVPLTNVRKDVFFK